MGHGSVASLLFPSQMSGPSSIPLLTLTDAIRQVCPAAYLDLIILKLQANLYLIAVQLCL